MDLPPGAEREFYGAIGYLPLGNHAIRADMVERLAAMARQAVRESRESRAPDAAGEEGRGPAEGRAPIAPAPAAGARRPTRSANGRSSRQPSARASRTPAPAPEAKAEDATPETRAGRADRLRDRRDGPKLRGSRERPSPALTDGGDSCAGRRRRRKTPARRKKAEREGAGGRSRDAEAEAEEPKPEEPKPEGPRPLPPGWFRATPQMMSLVGCSEPEMADVLRGLGYRVHPPSEESGPLLCLLGQAALRARARGAARAQRLQERERRDQRRRERPGAAERAAVLRRLRRVAIAPGQGAQPAVSARPAQDGPDRTGRAATRATAEGRPAARRSPWAAAAAPRQPTARRCGSTPRPRRRATSAANSPFAKLLELKLGGKK